VSEAESKLLQLIQSRAFRRGTFQLASGGTSDYYIDGKMVQVFSKAVALIGEVIYEHTRDLDIAAIGGMAVGAIPLTTAAVFAYHLHDREMEGFWVRDEVKKHGTQKAIEGVLKPGSRVVILDDVVTKGGSSLKAIEQVQEIGCTVVRVLALVDRLQGAEQLFREHGVNDFRAVFTVRDLGINVAMPGTRPTNGE
jgi:orotate phosphoribosyltransferase